MKYFTIFMFLLGYLTQAQQNISPYSPKEFNDYWYAGKAEISSYNLEQARYGEIRKGNAVNIFVTEPFSKASNTKADHNHPNNISVLKLNATKKFNTGVYPYSIMTSTFLPINKPKNSLKISSSTQEWCGHEYVELTEKENAFVLNNSSYFEGSSYQNKQLNKTIVLENDIWSIIRLKPENLPIGELNVLPDFVYIRFAHIKTQAYKAVASLKNGKNTTTYQLYYPKLDRNLNITFENTFPYKILNWTETYNSGWGNNRKKMTTKATLKKTLYIDYWNKNSNSNLSLKKSLGL